MNITIREMDERTVRAAKHYGSSFEVTSKLVLKAENGKITYTIVDVPPYVKQYGREEFDSAAYVSNPDRAIFLAYVTMNLPGRSGS